MFYSDLIVILPLLAGVAAGMYYLFKRIRWLLPVTIGAVVVILTFGFPLILVPLFWWDEEGSGVLDRCIPIIGKTKIIELDKFKTFSGNRGDRYYSTVLIKNPPKDTDRLKALMAEYFYKKSQYIDSVDAGSYLGDVDFWKYTRRTAYFIKTDEHPGGFSPNYLDKYPDTKIGYIKTRTACGSDSKKFEDKMYIYKHDPNGRDYEEVEYSFAGRSGGGAPVSGCYTIAAREKDISPKDVSSNPNKIAMVFVEGGTLTVGCVDERGNQCMRGEKPAHSVTVGNFYIGKYEVTQGLWKAMRGNNPSVFNWNDNLPVENVDWYRVTSFISNLNEKTGKKYRLPTEAEWEYAARGGNSSNGYEYSGDSIADNVAWSYENSYETHQAGTKQPNELGIHDMSGNVWEWTSDEYEERHRVMEGGSTPRVYRGGGWNVAARSCRVYSRYGEYPSYQNNYLGFRLALDP